MSSGSTQGFHNVGRGVRGARTDQELYEAVNTSSKGVVVVKYGTSWCQTCKAVLPHYLTLSQQFPSVEYVVASVENMQEAVKDINYSPHFAFFRAGRKVDEFYGNNIQRLRDRIWLHDDS